MPEEIHYRKLERMYESAPCNVYYAPKIAISKGRAEVTIPVRDDLFHTGGADVGAADGDVGSDVFAASTALQNLSGFAAHRTHAGSVETVGRGTL